jgi:ABC-2 type transport system permease protein
MSRHRLFTIARKEFHHVTRDVRTLFLVTIAPAFLLFTLAYVFSMDADHFNLIVLDQDRTELSRQLVADLTSDDTFHVVAYVERQGEIDAWLQAGRAHVALVIPPGTDAALRAFRPAPVQAILDGVDSIAASQALGQLNARTSAFALTLLPQVNGPALETIDVRGVVWYNPPLKSLNSMVPGLMALVLTMPALAFALSLSREKELGSFEGLASTPIHGLDYILGKMITYIGFGLLSTLPMILVATLWFRVPMRGSLITFLALATCYFFASSGLSVLVANFVKSQQTAMLVVILVFFVPSFFLAGLILPVDTSSLFSSVTAFVLPATHFIVIARGVFLKGLSIGDLVSPTLTLLVMGGGTLVLGLALFRKWIV